MNITYFTHQGTRDAQEDRYCITENFAGNNHLTLICVCDGHGGSAACDMLIARYPKLLADIILECNKEKKYTQLMAAALKKCVEEWDTTCFGDALPTIKKQSDKEKFFKTRNAKMWEEKGYESGATICAVLIDMQERKLNILHLGDSRATWLCNDEKLIGSTVDHSVPLVMKPNKNFPFVYGDGYIQDDLAMCRSFGDNNEKDFGVILRDPDLLCVKLGDSSARLVVATDGLFDWVSNHGVLYDEFKSAMAIANLINEFEDNITVVYVKIPAVSGSKSKTRVEEETCTMTSKASTKTPACVKKACETSQSKKATSKSPVRKEVGDPKKKSVKKRAPVKEAPAKTTPAKTTKKSSTTVKTKSSVKGASFEDMLSMLDVEDNDEEDDEEEEEEEKPAKKQVAKKKTKSRG